MLSREDNDRLTRVGPGTPMGELMRRYWIPAAFSHQIAKPDSPPVRVRLMGERLVMFRDTQGPRRPARRALPASHRVAVLRPQRGMRAALRLSRLEVRHRRQLRRPAERAARLQSAGPHQGQGLSLRRARRRGVDLYGAGRAQAGIPRSRMDAAFPTSHRYATRHIQECNWLQGLEGGFDSSHLSFLHGGDAHERDGASCRRATRWCRPISASSPAPAATWATADIFWTANVMLMPFHKIIASTPARRPCLGADRRREHDALQRRFHRSTGRSPKRTSRARKAYNGIHTENIPGTDRAIQNRDNDYLIDRALQASGSSYTGMRGLGIQDCAIQESMGPIADRTHRASRHQRHRDREDPPPAAADAEGPRRRQAAARHAIRRASACARHASRRRPAQSFAETMERHVRIDALVPAE